MNINITRDKEQAQALNGSTPSTPQSPHPLRCPSHPPLAQVIDGCQADFVACVGLELGYGVLLVLATVHLRPLPAAAEQLQYEGSDPGAVVLQVVRGPPDRKDTT